MVTKPRLVYVVTIFFAFQVLMLVDATKFTADESYSEDEESGRRKSSLTMGVGAVGEDYADLSDSEYLRRAIRALSVDVSSLRRTVRDLYKSDLSAIRKTVERLADNEIYSTMQDNLQSPRSSNIITPMEDLIRERPVSEGFGDVLYRGAGVTPYRDELAQFFEANFASQIPGRVGQTANFQNQANALSQILAGYRQNPVMSNGLGSGILPANIPTQLLLSRLA